jgi:DNA-binding XRE family transcriptional regulator
VLFKTDKQIMDELAKRVQAQRLQLNLTQENAAEKAGVSRSTVKSIESGQGCTLSNFIKVARAMGRADDIESLFKRQVRPTDRLKMQRRTGTVRMRASSKRNV